MKLATFDTGGAAQVGIVKDGKIKAVAGVSDMLDLIARYDALKAELTMQEADANGWTDLGSVHLRAPIEKPGKMMAIGLNYADHIAETGAQKPEQQIWFTKAQSAVNGPYDPIQIPKASPESVDYEVELVAVIGKGGRHISTADAPAAVFGYCVGNDVSVRAYQRHSPQWSVAKSFDTHAPLGPWITTADEIGDPHGRAIKCLVDGGERQSSNTDQLAFNVWDQIEYLSKAMTLEPGDVLFTGTPGGVGWAMKPEPGLLKPGQVVRCEIEGLGYIEGTCVPE